MPSSMIFISLVVLWLLILVPTVARRRQEVARPSLAALSGRVLSRSAAGSEVEQEADDMGGADRPDRGRAVAVRCDPHRTDSSRADSHRTHIAGTEDRYDDHPDPVDDATDGRPWLDDEPTDDRGWERPPPRYRPGRGGFDPEVAAAVARRRYAFRQRVVLALLIGALLTGLLAGLVLPMLWWAHALVDLALVGYLVYLRRQVRMEEAIRSRRSARMAGTRRPSAADDPELDEWARRGRTASRHGSDEAYPDSHGDDAQDVDLDGDVDGDGGDEAEDGPDDADRVRGTGEPVGLLETRGAVEGESALPRLRPHPTPPPPAGTELVRADDDDPDLHDLAGPTGSTYRRAAGQ